MSNENRSYYQEKINDRQADVYIYGDLTSWTLPVLGEVSAHGLAEEIKGLDVDTINVHIDSYGGEVSEGWGIYNALRNHPASVTTYADGFVASAALYPFLAGDRRVASTLSAFYLHEVMTGAAGYASDLRKAANEAEKMTEIGINAFVERAGMPRETVEALMKDETWLSASEAFDNGIATELVKADDDGIQQSARGAILQRIFAKQKQAVEPEPEPEQPVEAPAPDPVENPKTDEQPKNFLEVLAKVFEL